MVPLSDRKALAVQLGKLCRLFSGTTPWQDYASGITESEYQKFNALIESVHQHNGWFTAASVREALAAWGRSLTEANLEAWLDRYDLTSDGPPATVAVIGAGNIPFVVLHDLICVVLSGHRALVKYASDDNLLVPSLLALVEGLGGAQGLVKEAGPTLEAFDAVIATGSNNSARYFEYYFGKYPHIIRKHRNSLAVLDGSETTEELYQLGNDIFGHFGLGCRNVTQLWVPDGFALDRFFEAVYPFHDIISHNKYANNYDYNKAVWLLNREPLLDNGFLLLRENRSLAAPTASLHWHRYHATGEVDAFLSESSEHIQCVAGHGHIPFGRLQSPALWDYADGTDTLAFLSRLG